MKAGASSSKKSMLIEALAFGTSFLLVLGLCLFLALKPKAGAKIAEVVHEGEIVLRLDLEEDGHHRVKGNHDEVEIAVIGKKVAIVSSPCPSQFCVHQGYKDKEGESIICAYEGISVLLVGNAAIESIEV